MPKVLRFRYEQCLGLFTMLLFKGSSETGLFRHLSNLGFPNPQFRKYISYDGHFFLENFQNFIYIVKSQKRVEKKFSLLEIIAFQLPTLNSLY